MNHPADEQTSQQTSEQTPYPPLNPRSRFRLAILFVIFFVISLLTNMTGPLLPDIIRDFHLSLTMAAFLPFSFFIAYAVMSVPAGIIIERWGDKRVLIGSFALALCGSLLFSLMPVYRTAILSLFIIGLGMAALQVVINPLLRVSGGEEHFAINAVLAQLIFGSASFLSPLIYSYFVLSEGLPWVSMYWIFSALTLSMIVLILFVRFPRVERTEDEKVGPLKTHFDLLRRPVVWLYFLGIFSYVGLEQGLSNWMSQFLSLQHGFNPEIEGATAVSRFWGAITIGCFLGLLLLKFFDSRKVLLGFSAVAFVALGAAIFGSAPTALLAFPLVGFSISVMWSIIFSLALNSLDKHHGTFSGILCTGIVGGALVPLLIGWLGDSFSLRAGLCFLFLPLLYIFLMGLWAQPLIRNKTVQIVRD